MYLDEVKSPPSLLLSTLGIAAVAKGTKQCITLIYGKQACSAREAEVKQQQLKALTCSARQVRAKQQQHN